MAYKIPKIPILTEMVGVEKRVQDLQQNISELDWLEYSFGLAKGVNIGNEEDENIAPMVYTGVNSDSLDVRMWPDDTYKSYAFWVLTEANEFLYYDNVNAARRSPKMQQPIALIVCLDNKKISHDQDHTVTHSVCREELIDKLNNKNISNGIFQITAVIQNVAEVFGDFETKPLQEPYSCFRVEGLLTYTKDCT